jgi:hypothetical protein
MLNEETRSVNGLQGRFLTLLEQYVPKLRIRGVKAIGCSPCHDDRHPSFSANIETGVWYCHTCNIGGGVKKFAELVGEPWAIARLPRQEKRRIAASIRLHKAEQQAHAILQQRTDERFDEIFSEWQAVQAQVTDALSLLHVFHRWPHLAEEFPDLAAKAERDYGDAMFDRSILDARMGGELL